MFTLSSEAHGFLTSVVDENQTPSWLHRAECAYPVNFPLEVTADKRMQLL